MELNSQELATVLAALRFWQRKGPTTIEWDIATNGGKFLPLDDNEIDDLCEKLNQ